MNSYQAAIFLQSDTKAFSNFLVQGFVMFEEWFESFQDFHFARHAGLWRRLSLDHRHPQRPLVSRDKTFQVLEQEPRVVPLGFQLRDLFILLQYVLAGLVQLFRQGRKFLE